ncbi:MAG: DNA topoisomerase 4 subunit A [Deltaproteobacteria bacterium]|nr:DNA topoisomerase 4 subunit A [Deltaproteobacteria bacterium]
MPVIDVALVEESQNRYLTYALSVVSGRALPDVRDGLKPVQRRIIYAMYKNLRLVPEKAHRKSAAVVGEVLARFHPHGDTACYDAMVRMAQEFSLRYPLVDGQGNFGSLDGDAAAAYRYTEARLTPIALEVVGDINQETVFERDNFDQTVKEPVVLPARIPNLIINGASGIAVGMATAIPPHNLKEVINAILLILEEPSISDASLLKVIKGPDFPTGCELLNTRSELEEIYSTGKGAIRMRASFMEEEHGRKRLLVFTSIPYAIDKSVLVEKIADLILEKKLPQLLDVRDESTDEVRIVTEVAPDANTDSVLAYLFKHTALQANFNVNLTALVPTKNPLSGKPMLLSLRAMLEHFVDFRLEVVRKKLMFEKRNLEARIHLLNGLVLIFPFLEKVIDLIRKSEGRGDAAKRLEKAFKLSEEQALFIVDLRLYQLSKTSIDEVEGELEHKTSRVNEINALLSSEKALKRLIADELERISAQFGDKRRSKVLNEFAELEYVKEAYVQHEDVKVIVSKDGWIKRIKSANDPSSTRVRQGDSVLYALDASTRDSLAIFSTMGNAFVSRVSDITATSGFGEPVQKLFKFQDGEQIAACVIVERDESGEVKMGEQEMLIYSKHGLGFRFHKNVLSDTKKIGKRLMKLGAGDVIGGVLALNKEMLLLVSEQGYGLCILRSELPLLGGAAKGVILQRLPKGDALVIAACVAKHDGVTILTVEGAKRKVDVSALGLGKRASRGLKVAKKSIRVVGLA